MRAFHGDPAVKAKYLARVRAHRGADELIRGIGWDGHRGCAVGCTLDAYDHSRYPIELGVPEVLARLEDAIFEGVPEGRALDWPERFIRAIPVGADLSLVWPRFAYWLLTEELRPWGDLTAGVADLYAALLAGIEVPESEWAAAREAARAAEAAEAEARAAAAREAAARAAAWAARAAEAEAREAYERMADKLVELLRKPEVRS